MFDRLPRSVRLKLESFEESGMGYRIVTVTLKDGRRFADVILCNSLFGFRFGAPVPPFRLRDIVDLQWGGYRGSRTDVSPIIVQS